MFTSKWANKKEHMDSALCINITFLQALNGCNTTL